MSDPITDHRIEVFKTAVENDPYILEPAAGSIGTSGDYGEVFVSTETRHFDRLIALGHRHGFIPNGIVSDGATGTSGKEKMSARFKTAEMSEFRKL